MEKIEITDKKTGKTYEKTRKRCEKCLRGIKNHCSVHIDAGTIDLKKATEEQKKVAIAYSKADNNEGEKQKAIQTIKSYQRGKNGNAV